MVGAPKSERRFGLMKRCAAMATAQDVTMSATGAKAVQPPPAFMAVWGSG